MENIIRNLTELSDIKKYVMDNDIRILEVK